MIGGTAGLARITNWRKTVTYVEIKKLNTTTHQIEVLGTIGWDGANYHLTPPDSPVLQEVLNEPILLRSGEVTSADPERFLDNLQNKFRGTYLWATAPRTR